MIKKVFCIGLASAIFATASGNGINAFARETTNLNSETQKIDFKMNNINENLEDDEFKISISENSETRTVVTYNKLTNEKSTVIFDKATNKLHDENGNYIGTGYAVSSRRAYGPFKAYFDINPVSVSTIVGAILAIPVIVSTAGSAGITLAALKAGAKKLFAVSGIGGVIASWVPGCSINGYFQYSQEISSNGKRARNINRRLYARSGYKNKYSYFSFGNGGWFDTVKPF